MKYTKGSCRCRKVKFQVAMPVTWAGHCHCLQCQQLHGAAFVTWIGFKADDFKIIDPESNFKTYDSGKANRGFCTNCGSSFYFKYNEKCTKPDWKKCVFFSRPNIHTKINFEPIEHIYYESHASWFKVLDKLPKRKN